jgi:outer membrane immunogenic protein
MKSFDVKSLAVACIAVFALTCGSALAADMSVKARPVVVAPAPVPTWTGCYVNGGFGYGMFNNDHYGEFSDELGVPQTDTTTSGGRGWLGAVGAGCDYQFPAVGANFLVGAFGDYDFMSLKGQFEGSIPFGINPVCCTVDGPQKEQSAWAVGARLGYLVTPTLLSYVNGGYTEARFDQINLQFSGIPISGTPLGSALGAQTYHGWFLGGGTEYAFTGLGLLPIPGLFWRNEYRYATYRGVDLNGIFTCCGGGPAPFTEHSKIFTQTITTALVWRFNYTGH